MLPKNNLNTTNICTESHEILREICYYYYYYYYYNIIILLFRWHYSPMRTFASL